MYCSSLQIFGEDIRDAYLNQDVLVVAHSRGYYRMYSLPWLLAHHSVVKATLGEWVELGHQRAGVMGETGFGVPLTLNIIGMWVSWNVLLCAFITVLYINLYV